MMYLSVVTKPPFVIVEKEIIEAEKLKYTLQIIKRMKTGYGSIKEEVKALISEKIDVETYTVMGNEVDHRKFEKRGQFKIIHLVYEPAIPKVVKPKLEDPMVSELKHVVITDAILFIMNNDGRTIDTVSCFE